MAVTGQRDAQISPRGVFSSRQSAGSGVKYHYNGGVALWGNLGDETLNPRNFVTYFNDFFTDSDVAQTGVTDHDLWTLTQLTGIAGTFDKVDDTVEGLAVLDVGGATANHGVQVQHVDVEGGGEMLQPHNVDIVSWEARGSMDEAESADWFIGIANTDTTLLSATGTMVTANNFMGFLHAAAATTVSLVQCGTLNANQVVVVPSVNLWTPADASDTKRRLGLRIENNDKMYWYVDDLLVGSTHVGALETGGADVVAFSEAMATSFATNNGAGGQSAMTIDYVMHQSLRPE